MEGSSQVADFFDKGIIYLNLGKYVSITIIIPAVIITSSPHPACFLLLFLYKNIFEDKGHLLYEPGYAIPCVGNLMEGMPWVNLLQFPTRV
jgi:hypothetical protein